MAQTNGQVGSIYPQRNAIDHGIEDPLERQKWGKPAIARLVLKAYQRENFIFLEIRDDGRGMDPGALRAAAVDRGLLAPEKAPALTEEEALQLIYLPGFSTKATASEISGRGVGMDVVHSEIKQLGGSMSIHSQVGQGTEFVVRLPFTVSVNRALMVRIGDDLFAVPLNSIEGIVRVSPFELENQPPVTNTPDPCAAENMEAEVQKVHAFMREFDDAALLAGNIMQGVSNGQLQMSNLSDTIPNLQRIHRDAENQPTPSCIVSLKTYQINHMNTVLNSLSALLSGDQQGFDQNVMTARQYHDAYTLELARLLGLTVEPASIITPEQTLTP